MELSTKIPQYDVIISGAGPAGATTALHLKDLGFRVAILDKAEFPRDKICGDALSGTVPFELSKLASANSESFRQFTGKTASNGIRFVAPGGKILDLKINTARPGFDAPGYVSTRYDFDNFLVEQIRKSDTLELFQNCDLIDFKDHVDHIELITSKGILKTKFLVAADGALSKIAKRMNPGIDKNHHSAGLRQYYKNVTGFADGNLIELHFFKRLLPGYFWIFPLPGNRANVGVGMLSSAVGKRRVNLKSELEHIINFHPAIAPRFVHAEPLEKIQGYGLPLGSKHRKLSTNRCILTGDAAGLIDPFSGEGIGNAMTSGRIAAQHIISCFESNSFDAEFNKKFDRAIYKKLDPELKISYQLQKLLRFPSLFDWVVRKANNNPHMHRFIEQMLTDSTQRKELTRPSFYYKLLFNPKLRTSQEFEIK